jgi:hypothetical protein
MDSGSIFALVAFLVGIFLLLGWLYVMVGNQRSSRIFKKSLLFFVVPMLLFPPNLLGYPLSMFFLVTCEEALKALAARGERGRMNRFWLVSLFGIWELVLTKPLWGAAAAQSNVNFDGFQLAGLLYAAILPVFMHAVTAAIYAFRFRGHLWAALAAAWMVHIAFNLSVGYFGVSVTAALVETVTLVVILLIVLPRALRPHRIFIGSHPTTTG